MARIEKAALSTKRIAAPDREELVRAEPDSVMRQQSDCALAGQQSPQRSTRPRRCPPPEFQGGSEPGEYQGPAKASMRWARVRGPPAAKQHHQDREHRVP